MATPHHTHAFVPDKSTAERRTWIVVILTATMMVVEILGGWIYNSMAVFADGWHMSTHAAALSITGIAYVYSRKRANDSRFAFGPWKAEALGGYTSAILLVLVAFGMAWQSILRMFKPVDIHYTQSLIIASVGLAVNAGSALLLKGRTDHHHDRHDHRRHQDLNLRSAYLHVIADAATSVGAIIALVAARLSGFALLDPIMGMVGSGLICVWGYGLLRDTSKVLMDREMDADIVQDVHETIEATGDTKVVDFHLWRVGRSSYACALVLETRTGRSAGEYRKLLCGHEELVHSTIEIDRLPSQTHRRNA